MHAATLALTLSIARKEKAEEGMLKRLAMYFKNMILGLWKMLAIVTPTIFLAVVSSILE